MPNKIFTGKTDKKVEAIVVSIKLLTIVGGEPGDAPGKAIEEEIHLNWGHTPKHRALACLLLWARTNGLPFERPALDGLIKELKRQAPIFKGHGKKNPPLRGRGKGSVKDFAKLVSGMLDKRLPRDEIDLLTWRALHPRLAPAGVGFKEHKKRVIDTIYNLTKRRNPPRKIRKNSAPK